MKACGYCFSTSKENDFDKIESDTETFDFVAKKIQNGSRDLIAKKRNTNQNFDHFLDEANVQIKYLSESMICLQDRN